MDSQALSLLLQHGSYVVMFVVLVAGGLGLPLPEDIVLLAGGVLIHQGVTNWIVTGVVCFAGVLCGDVALFLTARRLGQAALDRPAFRRLLPERRRRWAEELFQRYGPAVVFAARHVAGIRAPVFALAGINGMRPVVFLLWDFVALCVSAPLTIAVGYLFSDHLDAILHGAATVRHFVVLGVLVAVPLVAGYLYWRYRHRHPA